MTEHHSLVEATKRVPRGVICRLSALRLQGLTTQARHEVWIAIAHKEWRPRADEPPMRNRRKRPQWMNCPWQRESVGSHQSCKPYWRHSREENRLLFASVGGHFCKKAVSTRRLHCPTGRQTCLLKNVPSYVTCAAWPFAISALTVTRLRSRGRKVRTKPQVRELNVRRAREPCSGIRVFVLRPVLGYDAPPPHSFRTLQVSLKGFIVYPEVS